MGLAACSVKKQAFTIPIPKMPLEKQQLVDRVYESIGYTPSILCDCAQLSAWLARTVATERELEPTRAQALPTRK